MKQRISTMAHAIDLLSILCPTCCSLMSFCIGPICSCYTYSLIICCTLIVRHAYLDNKNFNAQVKIFRGYFQNIDLDLLKYFVTGSMKILKIIPRRYSEILRHFLKFNK